MSNEANIQLLQESLEALNAGDADRFMATIHDEVTWSLDASKVPISGIKALHAVIDAMIVAMPDMNYELQQILGADDDHVIIRYILRGTHEGEFLGIRLS
jgi:predicted ester cyclase